MQTYLNITLRGLAGAAFAAAAWLSLGAAQPALAGTVILEGSDAIGFHCGFGNGDACNYRDQAWTAIGGVSPLPIAVVGSGTAAIGSGTHPVVDLPDLSTAGALSQYSALYFVAGGGCCSSDPADMAGRTTDVQNYVAAGGTVMIENYDGNAAWDFLVGAGGSGNANVAGVGGGSPATSDSCDDGETVTAAGLANGFTQPAAMGCWTHQSYNEAFFGALGFTESFFNSPPGMVSGATAGWSSLLSNGHTNDFGHVPEPASLALLGVALAGIGAARRRRR